MEGGGEHWDIVSLPAEAEAGDLLGREPGQWLVGRCLWLWRAAPRAEGDPAPAQLVGALPAAAGARHRRLFQGGVVPHLHARPAARNALYLRRIGLRRHLGWRRLHGARRHRRRPGKPHVSARSLAWPDNPPISGSRLGAIW
jgi:hypothetical protein